MAIGRFRWAPLALVTKPPEVPNSTLYFQGIMIKTKCKGSFEELSYAFELIEFVPRSYVTSLISVHDRIPKVDPNPAAWFGIQDHHSFLDW